MYHSCFLKEEVFITNRPLKIEPVGAGNTFLAIYDIAVSWKSKTPTVKARSVLQTSFHHRLAASAADLVEHTS